MSVSVGRMSPSWNQRRAMPVVTMMTFQRRRLRRRLALAVDDADAQLGRARGSPRRSGGSRASCRCPCRRRCRSPCRERASSRTRCAVLLLEVASRCGARRASSIVSQAARVGAMTMTRPVGGSAATNASWSGREVLVADHAARQCARASWRRQSSLTRVGERLASERLHRTVANLLTTAEALASSAFVLVFVVDVVVAEDHAAVRRTVLHRRRAIGRRRLLRGRHPVEPDAAHALRRARVRRARRRRPSSGHARLLRQTGASQREPSDDRFKTSSASPSLPGHRAATRTRQGRCHRPRIVAQPKTNDCNDLAKHCIHVRPRCPDRESRPGGTTRPSRRSRLSLAQHALSRRS